MKTKLIIGVLLLFAALLIIPVAADESESAPTLPFQVYGSACFSDGESLPVGTVVTATVDGVTSTFTITEPGKIGGAGTFDDKFLINGTTNGSPIDFKINGIPVNVEGGCTFVSGDGKQISLTLPKKEAEVKPDAGTKDTFKEKPIIFSAPAGTIPDTFTLTIEQTEDTPDLPKQPENTTVFKRLDITPSQAGIGVLLLVSISAEELKTYFGNDVGNFRMYHKNGNVWDEQPVVKIESKAGESIFLVRIDSFSPFMIAAKESAGPTPAHGGSSQDGTSTVLGTPTPTATPTPAAQTPVPVVGDTSSVKPIGNPAQQSKSPAPILGILAGLGAAAVLFAARQRR